MYLKHYLQEIFRPENQNILIPVQLPKLKIQYLHVIGVTYFLEIVKHVLNYLPVISYAYLHRFWAIFGSKTLSSFIRFFVNDWSSTSSSFFTT